MMMNIQSINNSYVSTSKCRWTVAFQKVIKFKKTWKKVKKGVHICCACEKTHPELVKLLKST